MSWSRRSIPIFVIAGFLAGCAEQPVSPQADAQLLSFAAQQKQSALEKSLNNINAKLAAAGQPFAVARAEFSLASGGRDAVTTVYAADLQLRYDSRWVRGDELRVDGNEVSYGYYLPLANANGSINSVPAIDRAVQTWNNLTCSSLPVVKKEVPPTELPSVILGTGALPSVDIAQLGFLPGVYFDALLGPGASEEVLGVTWTFIWGSTVNNKFIPSDIDRNHRDDTAFKEIWYNNALAWTDVGAAGKADIETVALHETGHALELGHFGRVAITNGKLIVSPRAVMNAFILGVLRQPLGTDNSAYCGNWANWGS